MPAISFMGDTADSSSSTTRLDFSSMVVVMRYWPLVRVDIMSRIMKAIGSSSLRIWSVCRSTSRWIVRRARKRSNDRSSPSPRCAAATARTRASNSGSAGCVAADCASE